MASAAEFQYARVGAFFSTVYSGTDDGSLIHQQRLAVNRATGRVYLADVVGDRIRVFDPTADSAVELAPLGSGDLNDPLGVAIDQSSGDLYVADADGVTRYDSDGQPDAGFATVPASGPLAFDQSAGELVVADVAGRVVRHFERDGTTAGAAFDGSDGSSSFTNLQDVAVTSEGDVIVVDSDGDPALGTGTSRVEQYSSGGQWEQSYGPVAGAATVAVSPSTGEVLVSGNQDAVNTNTKPTLFAFEPDEPTTPVEELPVDDETLYSTVRGMALDDGPAARLYVATDVGVPYDGAYGNLSVQVYARPVPTAPEIVSTGAAAAFVEADLRARIAPGRRATTYHFEYGATAAYGNRTSEASIAAGADPVALEAHVRGLAPATTYHYRVVAGNVVGTTTGPDRTFTTAAPLGPDGCANAAVRVEQDASFTPDCRAWELVSPLDKNDGDAGTSLSYWGPSRVSTEGGGVAYTSNDTFADPVSSSGSAYLSRRTAAGWETRSVLPRLRQVGGAGNQASVSTFFSPDLMKTFVWTDAPLTGDSPDARNLYLRDNVTESYRLLTRGAPTNALPGLYATPTAVGVSDDFSRAIVQSPLALTADASPSATSQLYEWSAGSPDGFRLAGRLPDGSFDPGGAQAGGLDGTGRGSIDNALSDDGSRLYFNAPAGSNTVYMSVNGGPSQQVSANGRFWSATRDGSSALFVERPGALDAGLRRYDIASGTTVDLSPDDEPADGGDPGVLGLLGAADDFSRVYFVATGRLVAGAGVAGANNLYVTRGGEVDFIATLDGTDSAQSVFSAVGYPSDGQRAVTADGRRVAFTSVARLTDYDNTSLSACPADTTGRPAGACRQVYLYDDATGELSCPSCGGAPADALLRPASSGNVITSFPLWEERRQNFSADGARLAFQTTGALTPQDGNGATDVYQWSGGDARLLSSGGGEGGGSLLMGIDPSGDEIFFTTRDRLVSWDTANDNDVYVARVGGGFPAPAAPPPPCAGDACRGLPTAPPSLPIAASLTFLGAGNVAEPSPRRGRATAVRVTRPRAVRGNSARLRLTLPSAGTVRGSGRGLRPVSRRVARAGRATLTVRLTRATARRLARAGRFTTTVRVRFSPRGGTATSASVRLTFLAARGGR